MLERKHWLNRSSILPLLHEAIETVERTITNRLDVRGELERAEPIITTVLMESLERSLDSVSNNLRDLQESRTNQPAVSRFEFTICDMQPGNRDVLGADVAFVFRTRWDNEFTSKRGILLQAKRLGPMAARTRRQLDQETRRNYGVSLEEWEDFVMHVGFRRLPRPPRARIPLAFLSPWLVANDERLFGDFSIDTKQLDYLLSNVVSSYYLFYDFPDQHLMLPCVQALTIKGLVDGINGSDVSRASVFRHAMSLTELLVQEFIGCRIGEWNHSFEQLEHIADQRRVGPVETPQGDFNVHAYNVSFIVLLDMTLLPSATYESEQ